MHFRIVCLIKLMSAARLDQVSAHDTFNFCTSHVHAFFFHAYVLSFLPFLSMCCVSFCSLSLSLSLSLRQIVLLHPNNTNLLQLRTLFKVSGHPLLFPHLTSGFVIRRPRRTSFRTSKNVAFIQNARLFCRILLTLLSSKLFGLEIENLYLRDPRGVLSCLFRSFTPTYTASISMCLSLLLHLKVHVSQLLQILSEVLYIPRVVHPDYLGDKCLWTVSREDLLSHFCEKPSLQGGALNTPCSSFAKGPHFLNMVMTFYLTPLSHYNSITKPRARFLLSLMEGLSIDFPSHFIIFILDVYLNTTTCDKLIFPSIIMQILQHFSIPIPLSPLFIVMGAISTDSV